MVTGISVSIIIIAFLKIIQSINNKLYYYKTSDPIFDDLDNLKYQYCLIILQNTALPKINILGMYEPSIWNLGSCGSSSSYTITIVIVICDDQMKYVHVIYLVLKSLPHKDNIPLSSFPPFKIQKNILT